MSKRMVVIVVIAIAFYVIGAKMPVLAQKAGLA